MKFSIRNLAKTGIFLSLLAFSSSLQANENNLSLEGIEQIELKNNNCGAKHHHKSECKEDEAKVLVSEELWRTFVIKLKDGIETITFGFPGNEFFVIQQSLNNIAEKIDRFITPSGTDNDNFSIQSSLIQLTFNLYAYSAALQFNNADPAVLQNVLNTLQTSTDELVLNLLARLQIREVRAQAYVRIALEQWLFSTKNLVQDFVYANRTGEWDGLFVDFNDSVNLFQIVGGIVGKYKGCQRNVDDLSVTSDLFSSSNSF